MATKTFYLKNVVVNNNLSLQDGGTAPTAAVTTTGWTVAKVAAARFSLMSVNSKQASTAFATTDPLASPTSPLLSSWRSENTLTGTFDATAWTLTFQLRAVSAAASQAGRVKVRIYKSTSPTANTYIEISGGVLTGSTTAALSTTASQSSVVTWTPAAPVSFSAEYLFVQCEWEITTASSNNSGDVLFYIESAAAIATSDFGTGSGGVSGTGIIFAARSGLIGSGTVADRVAAGVVAAGAAVVSGSGTVATAASITGTGSFVAGSATIAGVAVSASAGTAALIGGAAALAGSGVSASVGTGALAARSAAVAGTGISASIGTGSLVASASAVAGTGAAVSVASAIGALAAQAAALAGAGVSASVGAGALAAASAATAGTATATHLGTGTLVAGAAEIAGEGAVLAAGDAVAPGAMLPLTLSLVAGAASGEGQQPPLIGIGGGRRLPYPGTAPGALFEIWVSLQPGRAIGVERRENATARGAVLPFSASLRAGAATGDATGYDNDLIMLLAA